MNKTYMSKAPRLRIIVEKNGERISIPFEWDIVSEGGAMGSSFTTDDAALQKAIEAHNLFGSMIWCATPSNETDEANNEVETINTIADARQLLRDKYGKTAEETKTKTQVLTLLNEMGMHCPLNN